MNGSTLRGNRSNNEDNSLTHGPDTGDESFTRLERTFGSLYITVINSFLDSDQVLAPINISREQAAELIAPTNTVTIEEADAVFEQLIDDMQRSAENFETSTQAVFSKLNVTDRNRSSVQLPLNLQRDLPPSPVWSYFTYNCACKVAVPIFRVQACQYPALLQVTDFLANGDSYTAYGNDQLILKTPYVRSLGPFTFSLDPTSAMLSHDWSHGEIPIEARTEFTLKIVPRHVQYETGRGAVRLLPLQHAGINSHLFIVTNTLPYDQASDACAAFGSSLAILKNEKQVREVALALNKLPGCDHSVWFGGVDRKEPMSRLYLLYNPVSEQAVIERVARTDSSLREVLCYRANRK